MSRLLKYTLLSAALAVAACLTVGPGIGQVKPTLRMTVTKTDRVPPLDGALAPGNKFDKAIINAHVDLPKLTNNWHKIPAWNVGMWTTDQAVVTYSWNDTTLEEDRTRRPREWHCTYLSGTYTDKTGQVWQIGQAGPWNEEDSDQGVEHQLTILDTNTKATDTESVDQKQFIAFKVDKGTNKIASCHRCYSETYDKPISADTMSSRTIRKVFDWQGNLIRITDAVSTFRKIGNLVSDPKWEARDRQLAYPLFVQFLKDNYMADRVPDAPPPALGAVAKP